MKSTSSGLSPSGGVLDAPVVMCGGEQGEGDGLANTDALGAGVAKDGEVMRADHHVAAMVDTLPLGTWTKELEPGSVRDIWSSLMARRNKSDICSVLFFAVCF